jgi:hypothetical protein
MQRKAKAIVITLVLSASCLSHAQTFSDTSTEESTVRSAYAAVSFLCGLRPVTDAALLQIADSKAISQDEIDRQIAAATPVYDLSNFHTGSIASIQHDKFSDYVTVPSDMNYQILKVGPGTQSWNDNGYETSWRELDVKWAVDKRFSEVDIGTLNATIGDLIKQASDAEPNFKVITLTSYASYTVNTTYQGKSTGNYKALFLFGIDAHGKPVVFARDMLVEQPLTEVLSNPSGFASAYPAGLLKSRLRDTPAIEHFIETNRRQDVMCSKEFKELCCDGGKCGIRESSVRRDLAVQLPEPK